MSEENKVELDTDDVQETNISLEDKQKEETKPEIGEVDLGYNDPIKVSTEAKKVDEKKKRLKKHKKNKKIILTKFLIMFKKE